MTKYIIQRLVLAIPTVFLVSLAVFAIVRFLPGDAIDLLLSQNAAIYEGERERLEEDLGLNKPLLEDYADWLAGAIRLDFGESFWTRQPVRNELTNRLPATLLLGALSILFSVIIAVPIGLLSAYRQDGWVDYSLRSVAILGLAIPNFWIAIIVVVVASKYLGWSPSGKYVPVDQDPLRAIQSLLVPSVVLGIASAAALMRYVRTQALEVFHQDYVRTARAKGLQERIVMTRHALPNSLIPVITVIGLQLPLIVGGSVIIESIFAIPGIGSLTVEAINRRDYPTIQMINIVFAMFVVLSNLLVDICYPLVDPRLRYV